MLNATPSGERTHIAFFGCRNAGKSSLVNAFTNQKLSIVSDLKGTTTDPVSKSMELLPLGPVVIIDTPGMDDEGVLGFARIERAKQVLKKTDLAILVVDAAIGITETDQALLSLFKARALPCLIAYNKADLLPPDVLSEKEKECSESTLFVSAKTGYHIRELRELSAKLGKTIENDRPLVGDLVSENDKIILVIPIDKAAPKGRLILPQQQVIRDALDHGAIPLMCRDHELMEALSSLSAPPRMVITDSQAFAQVSRMVPDDIPLTSFSILMARYKGNLAPSVAGAAVLSSLRSGDRLLISEGCTHHRQCGDIGSVKLPALIRRFTDTEPEITLTSGTEFPNDLSPYRLVLHCGACMLNPAEAQSRYEQAAKQHIPITNYGTAIAYMNGILPRSLSLFPEVLRLIEQA